MTRGQQQVASTNADGRFDFPRVPPGTYRVELRAARYLPTYYGGQPSNSFGPNPTGKPIIVLSGERFASADVVVPRPSAIEGHLLDEFGDPAPGILVQVSQAQFAGGRKRLVPIGAAATWPPTDDKGYFRIHGIPPGDYYVAALSGAFSLDANQTGGFAPTYYPGTSDLSAARAVRVKLGEDASITMRLVPGPMVSISGRLVDPDGKPSTGGGLLLFPSDRLGLVNLLITQTGPTGPDGTFTFRNIPPGIYTIQGQGRPPESAPLSTAPFGWTSVTVANDPLEEIVVALKTGTSLRGRFVFEDGGVPPLKASDLSILMMPVDFDSAPIFGSGRAPLTVKDDGSFVLTAMSGRRRALVTIRSPGWSLKRISRNGLDVTDSVFDFRDHDVDEVEVVLTNRVSSVQGTVHQANGTLVDDCGIVIFAADRARWAFPSRFVTQAKPAQDGQFRIPVLPPGDYFAVAVPALFGTESQDPDFLERLAVNATRFTLSEGERKSLNLNLSKRPD